MAGEDQHQELGLLVVGQGVGLVVGADDVGPAWGRIADFQLALRGVTSARNEAYGGSGGQGGSKLVGDWHSRFPPNGGVVSLKSVGMVAAGSRGEPPALPGML